MDFIPIIDYPGYEINKLGEVRNVLKGNILKPRLVGGYLRIGLNKYNKQTLFTIHRLLARHFIPNPDNKPCVDHINKIKTDNRIENLRWVTHSENSQNYDVTNRNKLNEKNICIKKEIYYHFQKVINGIKYEKRFETLEEAIEYRDNFNVNNH